MRTCCHGGFPPHSSRLTFIQFHECGIGIQFLLPIAGIGEEGFGNGSHSPLYKEFLKGIVELRFIIFILHMHESKVLTLSFPFQTLIICACAEPPGLGTCAVALPLLLPRGLLPFPEDRLSIATSGKVVTHARFKKRPVGL